MPYGGQSRHKAFLIQVLVFSKNQKPNGRQAIRQPPPYSLLPNPYRIYIQAVW